MPTDVSLDFGVDPRSKMYRQLSAVVNRRYSVNVELSPRSQGQPLGKIRGELGEFEKSLEASNARVVAFGASAGAVYAVTAALKSTVRAAIDVEQKLTEISSIMGRSTSNLEQFGQKLFGIANEMGASFDDAAKAALTLSRQGWGLQETLKRTSDALLLTRLSGLGVEESVTAITAALNSFNKEAIDSTRLVNQFAAVDQKFAVSSADLAEGIKRVGSTASDAGVSMEQLIALITSAQHITSRGGAIIGNALKSIFTRLERPKVIEQLQGVGITIKNLDGTTRPVIGVLGELAEKFDTLTQAEQSHVAELVGGVYQMNILKATLRDIGKDYSFYTQALQTANEATDEAQRRSEELNKTLSSQIKRTVNDFTKGGAVAGGLVFTPAIRKVLNSLENGAPFGKVGESIGKGILTGIGKILSGPGLSVLTLVFFQLGRRMLKFVVDAFEQVSGLNAGRRNTINIETQLTRIMQRQPEILAAILNGTISVSEAAQNLLQILREQDALLVGQKGIVQGIATAYNAMGVSSKSFEGANISTQEVIRTKSAGHIPEEIEREGARRGGYRAGNIKSMVLEGKQIIYNDKEQVIPIRNSAFIVPPKGSKARIDYDKKLKDKGLDPKMFHSMGHMPNLANIKESDIIGAEPGKPLTRYLVAEPPVYRALEQGGKIGIAHGLTKKKYDILYNSFKEEYEKTIKSLATKVFNLTGKPEFSINDLTSFRQIFGRVFEDTVSAAFGSEGSGLSKDFLAGTKVKNVGDIDNILSAFHGELKAPTLLSEGVEYKASLEAAKDSMTRGQDVLGKVQELAVQAEQNPREWNNAKKAAALQLYNEKGESPFKTMGKQELFEEINRRSQPFKRAEEQARITKRRTAGKAIKSGYYAQKGLAYDGYMPNMARTQYLPAPWNQANRTYYATQPRFAAQPRLAAPFNVKGHYYSKQPRLAASPKLATSAKLAAPFNKKGNYYSSPLEHQNPFRAYGEIPNLADRNIMRGIFNQAHDLPNAPSVISKLREGIGLSNESFQKVAKKLGVGAPKEMVDILGLWKLPSSHAMQVQGLARKDKGMENSYVNVEKGAENDLINLLRKKKVSEFSNFDELAKAMKGRMNRSSFAFGSIPSGFVGGKMPNLARLTKIGKLKSKLEYDNGSYISYYMNKYNKEIDIDWIKSTEKGYGYKMFKALTRLSRRTGRPITTGALMKQGYPSFEKLDKNKNNYDNLLTLFPQLRYRDIPGLKNEGSVSSAGRNFQFKSLDNLKEFVNFQKDRFKADRTFITNLKSYYSYGYTPSSHGHMPNLTWGNSYWDGKMPYSYGYTPNLAFRGTTGETKLEQALLLKAGISKNARKNIEVPQALMSINPDDLHITLMSRKAMGELTLRQHKNIRKAALSIEAPKSFTFSDTNIAKRMPFNNQTLFAAIQEQGKFKDYVDKISQKAGIKNPEPDRMFHLSLANNTGNPLHSIGNINKTDLASYGYTPNLFNATVPPMSGEQLNQLRKKGYSFGRMPNLAISLSSIKRIVKEAKASGISIARTPQNEKLEYINGKFTFGNQTAFIPKKAPAHVLLHELGHGLGGRGDANSQIENEVIANKAIIDRLPFKDAKEFAQQRLEAFKTYKIVPLLSTLQSELGYDVVSKSIESQQSFIKNTPNNSLGLRKLQSSILRKNIKDLGVDKVKDIFAQIDPELKQALKQRYFSSGGIPNGYAPNLAWPAFPDYSIGNIGGVPVRRTSMGIPNTHFDTQIKSTIDNLSQAASSMGPSALEKHILASYGPEYGPQIAREILNAKKYKRLSNLDRLEKKLKSPFKGHFGEQYAENLMKGRGMTVSKLPPKSEMDFSALQENHPHFIEVKMTKKIGKYKELQNKMQTFKGKGELWLMGNNETRYSSSGRMPNLAYIPLVTPLVGRLATNVVNSEDGFGAVAFRESADFIKKHGIIKAVKNIIQDKPLYSTILKDFNRDLSPYVDLEGSEMGLGDFAFRKMFGLEPRHKFREGVNVRSIPTQKNTYAVSGEGVSDYYGEQIYKNSGQERFISKTKIRGLAGSFDFGKFDVEADIKKGTVRYSDTWDFALHQNEPLNVKEALKEAKERIFNKAGAKELLGNIKSYAKNLRHAAPDEMISGARNVFGFKNLRKVLNTTDKMLEQGYGDKSRFGEDYKEGYGSSNLIRLGRHLVNAVSSPITFVGQLNRGSSIQRRVSGRYYENARFHEESDKEKLAALGMMPNLSTVKDAVSREMKAGYTRDQVKIGFDPRIGPLVYNTTEGSASNAVNLHRRDGKSYSQIKNLGKSKGHIPNLADNAGGEFLLGGGLFAAQIALERSGGYKGRDLGAVQKNLLDLNLEKVKIEKQSVADLDGAVKRQLALNKVQDDILNAQNQEKTLAQLRNKDEKKRYAALITSFASPFVGGVLESAFSESLPKVGRAFSGLADSVSLASQVMFAIPGPIGTAAAVFTGALSAGSKVFHAFADKGPELEKELGKERDSLEQSRNSLNVFTQVFDKLVESYKSNTSSNETIQKLQEEYAIALAEVPDAYRNQVASASTAAGAQKVVSEALLKQAQKVEQLNLATNLRGKLDSSRGILFNTHIFNTETDTGKDEIKRLASRVISTSSNPQAFAQKIAKADITSPADFNNLIKQAEESEEITKSLSESLQGLGERAGGLQGFFSNASESLNAFAQDLQTTAKAVADSDRNLKITALTRKAQAQFEEQFRQATEDANNAIVSLRDSIHELAGQGLAFASTRGTLRNQARTNIGLDQITNVEGVLRQLGSGISETVKTSLESGLNLSKVQIEGAGKFRETNTDAVNKLFDTVQSALEDVRKTAGEIENGITRNPFKEQQTNVVLQSLGNLRGQVEGASPEEASRAISEFTRENTEVLGGKLTDILNKNESIIRELAISRATLDQDFRRQIVITLKNNQIAEQAARQAERLKAFGGAEGFLNPAAYKEGANKLIRGAGILGTRNPEPFKGAGAIDFITGFKEVFGKDLGGPAISSLRDIAIKARAKEIIDIGNAVSRQFEVSASGSPSGSIERPGFLSAAQQVRDITNPTNALKIAKDQVEAIAPLDKLNDYAAKEVSLLQDILNRLSPDVRNAFKTGGEATNQVFNFVPSSVNQAIGEKQQLIGAYESRQKDIANARDIVEKIATLVTQSAQADNNSGVGPIQQLFANGEFLKALQNISKSDNNSGRKTRAGELIGNLTAFEGQNKLARSIAVGVSADIRSAQSLSQLYSLFHDGHSGHVEDNTAHGWLEKIYNKISGEGAKAGGTTTQTRTQKTPTTAGQTDSTPIPEPSKGKVDIHATPGQTYGGRALNLLGLAGIASALGTATGRAILGTIARTAVQGGKALFGRGDFDLGKTFKQEFTTQKRGPSFKDLYALPRQRASRGIQFTDDPDIFYGAPTGSKMGRSVLERLKNSESFKGEFTPTEESILMANAGQKGKSFESLAQGGDISTKTASKLSLRGLRNQLTQTFRTRGKIAFENAPNKNLVTGRNIETAGGLAGIAAALGLDAIVPEFKGNGLGATAGNTARAFGLIAAGGGIGAGVSSLLGKTPFNLKTGLNLKGSLASVVTNILAETLIPHAETVGLKNDEGIGGLGKGLYEGLRNTGISAATGFAYTRSPIGAAAGAAFEGVKNIYRFGKENIALNKSSQALEQSLAHGPADDITKKLSEARHRIKLAQAGVKGIEAPSQEEIDDLLRTNTRLNNINLPTRLGGRPSNTLFKGTENIGEFYSTLSPPKNKVIKTESADINGPFAPNLKNQLALIAARKLEKDKKSLSEKTKSRYGISEGDFTGINSSLGLNTPFKIGQSYSILDAIRPNTTAASIKQGREKAALLALYQKRNLGGLKPEETNLFTDLFGKYVSDTGTFSQEDLGAFLPAGQTSKIRKTRKAGETFTGFDRFEKQARKEIGGLQAQGLFNPQETFKGIIGETKDYLNQSQATVPGVQNIAGFTYPGVNPEAEAREKALKEANQVTAYGGRLFYANNTPGAAFLRGLPENLRQQYANPTQYITSTLPNGQPGFQTTAAARQRFEETTTPESRYYTEQIGRRALTSPVQPPNTPQGPIRENPQTNTLNDTANLNIPQDFFDKIKSALIDALSTVKDANGNVGAGQLDINGKIVLSGDIDTTLNGPSTEALNGLKAWVTQEIAKATGKPAPPVAQTAGNQGQSDYNR